jgi:hypothetical protein
VILWFGSVSGFELTFALGGVVALAVNLALWRGTRGDLRDLIETKRNGLLLIGARGNVARERWRVVLQIVLLAAAGLALDSPDPTGPYADSPGRRAIIFLFLTFQWGLVASAWGDRRVRKRMIRYADEGASRRGRRATDRHPR